MCTARPELSGLINRTATTTSSRLVLNDLSPYVNYKVRCTSISTRSGSGSIINSCNSTMKTIRMPESGMFTHSLYILLLINVIINNSCGVNVPYNFVRELLKYYFTLFLISVLKYE